MKVYLEQETNVWSKDMIDSKRGSQKYEFGPK